MNKPLSTEAFALAEIGKAMDQDGVYKTLLESTRAIPWKIDWATKTFSYIGPQIEELLGWSPESWVTVEDWAARMHADDRDYVVNFCVSQSIAGVDHEADYRALTKNDGFVWIRDVVHVVRKDDGEVEALVGFMFDITERKKQEEQLLDMQRKLEALSFEDGLTGASNRRMFDSKLGLEFDAARRGGQPLTLMMVDLDQFKLFNDRYGHLAGDDALVKVASVLKQLGRRRRDVVARYGGEEFVLLLADTNAEAAKAMAERARAAIEALAIPHEGSVSGKVTASIGVGTIVPTGSTQPKALIESVDKLLYEAKQGGRNCVSAAAL